MLCDCRPLLEGSDCLRLSGRGEAPVSRHVRVPLHVLFVLDEEEVFVHHITSQQVHTLLLEDDVVLLLQLQLRVTLLGPAVQGNLVVVNTNRLHYNIQHKQLLTLTLIGDWRERAGDGVGAVDGPAHVILWAPSYLPLYVDLQVLMLDKTHPL